MEVRSTKSEVRRRFRRTSYFVLLTFSRVLVAQAPAAPVRLHSGIEPPRKIHDVMPAYPVLARTVGASGVVIIEATIDARGDVVAAKVLRSVPTLDQAAVDAVRQWKYTPARLNGEPVAVLITVTVNFMLGGR